MKVCRVLRPAVPFLLLISSLDGRSPAASKLPEKPNQVIVDVVVTDQSGQPVKGLREQDFRLFENDKRQKLDAFEEYAASAEPSAPPVPAKLPPNTFTNAASSAPDSINVILLDQLNTSESIRQSVCAKLPISSRGNQQARRLRYSRCATMILPARITATILGRCN